MAAISGIIVILHKIINKPRRGRVAGNTFSGRNGRIGRSGGQEVAGRAVCLRV